MLTSDSGRRLINTTSTILVRFEECCLVRLERHLVDGLVSTSRYAIYHILYNSYRLSIALSCRQAAVTITAPRQSIDGCQPVSPHRSIYSEAGVCATVFNCVQFSQRKLESCASQTAGYFSTQSWQ